MLLNIFRFVATYHGAILNHLSNPSWNISKDGTVIAQGTPGMEKLCESYGKATNHTREKDLANMEELSVWKSYEKAMGRPQTTLERKISPIWKSYWYGKALGKLWEI